MRNSWASPVCTVSNIKFTVPMQKSNSKRNSRVTFKKKKEQEGEEKQDTPVSIIRKHIESFIPASCYSQKKSIPANYNSCHREIKQLKGLQLTYKRFPIRKAISTSCISHSKRQTNYSLGQERNSIFSNKLINNSVLYPSSKSQVVKKGTNETQRASTSYQSKRRSIPSLFSPPQPFL